MRLSPPSRDLLRKVLAKREPRLGYVLDETSDPSLEDLSTIIDDVVGGELAETGFRDNSEPNERGRALEDLIDELNLIRWRLQAARDS